MKASATRGATGLTPACAGKTRSSRRPAPSSPAHPRVCGENFAVATGDLIERGSPPRVRGKPSRRRLQGPRPRLTPACAGKTGTRACAAPTMTAHPRVCGENWEATPIGSSAPGSPPRVRGKLGEALLPIVTEGSPPRVRGKHTGRMSTSHATGLTPACAGKTRAASAVRLDRGAHPRVCGENSRRTYRRGALHGSPPRVRGKHDDTITERVDRGLTPACAGKTSGPSCRRSPRPAHPRVCGENGLGPVVALSFPGSPPRVRGKPVIARSDQRVQRLTPACAGKTPSTVMLVTLLTAHPRVCGENQLRDGFILGFGGSPPRVRGKLFSRGS